MVLNAVTSPHTRRNYSECGSDSPRDFTIQAAFPLRSTISRSLVGTSFCSRPLAMFSVTAVAEIR